MKLFATCFLVLFTYLSGLAQTKSHKLSIDQAIQFAREHNYQLKNARLDEELNKKRVQEFVGLGYPQLSAKGTGQYFFDIPTQYLPNFLEPSIYGVLLQNQLIDSIPPLNEGSFPVQFGQRYNLSGSIEASQLIFDSQFFVGFQAQKELLSLSKTMTERTEAEAIAEVSKAYYNALIMQERLELLETNVATIEKLRNDTRALYDNGFVEKLDVDRITVTFNNLVNEQEKINKLYKLTEMTLKMQMGMDVNDHLTLTDTLEANDFETLLNSNFDANNRAEYQMLLTLKRVYGLEKKQHTLAHLPGLYSFASYGYSAQSDSLNFFDRAPTTIVNGQEVQLKRWYPIALVGLTLQVPIFDGLQKVRRVQQAKIKIEKTQNEIDQLHNAIALEANAARIKLSNSTLSLLSQKENMNLAENVYRTSKIKYDEGVGSSLEIVNAQAGLKEAQTNYLDALYEAYIARIDYLKATGQLK